MALIFSHRPTTQSNNSRDLYRTAIADEDIDEMIERLAESGHEINCVVPDQLIADKDTRHTRNLTGDLTTHWKKAR